MNRDELKEHLLKSHSDLMALVESESPSTTIRVKISILEGKKITFQVISSSTKTRLLKMVEEKVFMKASKGEIEGTVVEAYENSLVVQFSKKTKESEGNEVTLKIHSNHNNEILLDSAVKFFDSEKFIHPSILAHYKRATNTSNLEYLNETYENESNITFFNNKLNTSQKKTVEYALENTPFKILGPPGTGKTEPIIEIISQFLNMKKTVFVCGPSNISIDNIITRFITSQYNISSPTQFYRLGSSFKGLVHFNLEYIASRSVDFMEKEDGDTTFERDLMQRKQEFISNYKKNTPLVFSTLFSSIKESFFFDICIVDEACQSNQLECFMGLIKAKSFILAGDPNQLCPSFQSLYEYLDIPTILLNEQYRMHSDLLEFSNSYFYNNSVISSKKDEFTFFDQSKILFIDTSYFDYEEECLDNSKMNVKEGELVKKIVEWLKSNKETDIGVIAPYSAQVNYLREIVDAQVETVDGFQGQEKNFIVLSLVRSNDSGEIGFLRDRKRLNVAITRCRKGLVVIGDSQNFMRDDFFRQFFRFLEDRAYVVDPETLESMI